MTIFDLQAVRKGLDAEDWEEDPFNPGTETRSTFLGTVFALLPSGKYYMPWAHSNVAPCEDCGGKGCDACGHVGSKEAHKDALWYARAEEELTTIGCALASGEGDPCDLFATEYKDKD